MLGGGGISANGVDESAISVESGDPHQPAVTVRDRLIILEISETIGTFRLVRPMRPDLVERQGKATVSLRLRYRIHLTLQARPVAEVSLGAVGATGTMGEEVEVALMRNGSLTELEVDQGTGLGKENLLKTGTETVTRAK